MKLISIIQYQRYLGLTDIDYSSLRQCYVLKGNWISYCSQAVIQIILTAGIIESLLRTGYIYMDMKSRSVNLFHYIVILCIPITQILAGTWIRLQQATQLILLNKLTELAARLKVNTEKLPRPRCLFYFWMGATLYYICIFLVHSLFIWNPDKHLSFLLAFISLFVTLVRSNFIITSYTCLVHTVLVLLQIQADQIKINPLKLTELSTSLCFHDDLLSLCHQELVQVFSGAFIMIFTFYVLDATCLVYVATMKDRCSALDNVQTLLWLIPLNIYLTMPLMVNDLKRQVSKKRKKKKYISLLFMPFELLLDENFILFKYSFYINFIHNDISSYFTYTLIG